MLHISGKNNDFLNMEKAFCAFSSPAHFPVYCRFYSFFVSLSFFFHELEQTSAKGGGGGVPLFPSLQLQ